MASLLLSAIMPTASPPSSPAVGEALSGVFGSISLTAWICLLLPQLITNFKAQSADGLSMAFLFVWLLGDIANLSGALFTNLAPTAIALAVYFCIADLVLIAQCTYYNTLNARRRQRQAQQHTNSHGGAHKQSSSTAPEGIAVADEESPLLPSSSSRRQSAVSDSVGNPEPPHHPHHHHNHHRRRHSSRPSEDTLTRILTGEDPAGRSRGRQWLNNALSLAAVYLVGAAGWFVSWRMGAWEANPGLPDPGDALEPTAVVGMVLGYLSALLYLCARVPQIIKNYREKSCEGLSLLFFLLSLTGNFTYGASLLAYSQKGDYLVRTVPWLLGSLGTIVEDCIIFVQFRIYEPGRPKVDDTT